MIFALVPVFNRCEMTKRLVADLRAQVGVNVRIVVIDDGSTDETPHYLASQHDILAFKGSGDLWWAGSIDLALGNLLHQATDHDYFLLLNNDSSIKPDFAAKLLEVSLKHQGAVVGSVLRDISEPHSVLSIGPRIDVSHMRVRDLLDELTPWERSNLRPIYEVDALSGRGTLYPVYVLRRIGGMRPKLLPHYHADYELSARARRNGIDILVSTEAVTYTRDEFGVHAQPRTKWQRMFGKGSPTNLLHHIAFRLLIGTPAQRALAIPRLLVEKTIRYLPRHPKRAAHLLITGVKAIRSGEARARLWMYLSRKLRSNNYNAHHACTASLCLDVFGKSVLVVGCNTGRDCSYFVRLGAGSVTGLDVIENVGVEYRHRRVTYIRGSVEAIPSRRQTYDLVYCFATMEHVADIKKAFAEMVRVTRPGGIIYSVASPLWNSRYGHHKRDLFERFPWIHLLMSEEEILALCRQEGIADPTGRHAIEVHVKYMLNPRYFNMTPASQYVEICNKLPDVVPIENSLAEDDDSALSPELLNTLASKGYTREELLAVTHTYIGRKLRSSGGS